MTPRKFLSVVSLTNCHKAFFVFLRPVDNKFYGEPVTVTTANEDDLDSLEYLLLELPLNLLALIIGRRLAVQGQKRTQVKLGRLEELDLANVNLWNTIRNETLSCEQRANEHSVGGRFLGLTFRFHGQ